MVKLEKVWIGKGFDDQPDLRLDWSNDRHHAVAISHPGGPDEVADAFRSLAQLVYSDQKLRTPNAAVERSAPSSASASNRLLGETEGK